MIKKHFFWLILGILFWGSIPILIAGLMLDKSFAQLLELIIFFILLTAFVTIVIQFYIGGFSNTNPKIWFFIPISCWILFSIFQLIEGGSTDEWIIYDLFRKIFN
jgi:hypothetical protein